MSTEQPPTDAELAGTATVEPDPPVYDERGNVRPRGSAGTRPMTFEERAEIARRLGAGEVVGNEPELPEPKVRKRAAKRTTTREKS